jgi:hypothetical protein
VSGAPNPFAGFDVERVAAAFRPLVAAFESLADSLRAVDWPARQRLLFEQMKQMNDQLRADESAPPDLS